MIEKKEVKYAKQIDDVLALVEEIVKVVREKGEYAELVDEFISAVEGIDQVEEEAKDKLALYNTVSLRISSVAHELTK